MFRDKLGRKTVYVRHLTCIDPACKKGLDNNMIQVAKKHSSGVQDDGIDTTPQATVLKDITDWRTLVAHSFPGSNKRCPTNIHHQEALVDSYQL